MNDETTAAFPGGENPDVGSRISRALSIYTSSPLVFIALAAINLPIALLNALWTWGGLLGFIPGLFLGELLGAAILYAAYQDITGRSPAFSESIGAAFQRIGQLFEFTLRAFGSFFLLSITVIGFPWAIRIFVRWFMGTHGIILYGDSAVEAISRSCRLATGNWWRIFGNMLLVGLMAGSVGIAFVFIGGTFGAIGSAVWGTIAGPFVYIFTTLLFLRLVAEKSEQPPPVTTETQVVAP